MSAFLKPYMRATEELLGTLDGLPEMTHFVTSKGEAIPFPAELGDAFERLRTVFFASMEQFPENVAGGFNINNPSGKFKLPDMPVQPVRVVEEEVYVLDDWW